MSYENQPHGAVSGPAAPPAGWYLDPEGRQVLRWWDGAHWGPHTQPLPGFSPEPRPLHPDVTAPALDGYGVPQQERVGRHRQQSAPLDDVAHASSAPGGPPPEQDVFPPLEPQTPPGQQSPPLQPYAPGPQPQATAPHNTKPSASRWISGVLTAIGAIAVVSFALSHISSGGASSSNTAATGSAPGQASSVPPSCADQFTSWRDNGGLSQSQAFASDLSALQKADYGFAAAIQSDSGLSAAESNEQSAAASLQSDAQAVEANPAPVCIPGLRTDEGAAMADYSKVAADSENAMSEVGSGNYDVANADLRAATKAEGQGNTKLAAALADLNAFQNK